MFLQELVPAYPPSQVSRTRNPWGTLSCCLRAPWSIRFADAASGSMCPRSCGAFFILASASSFRAPVRGVSPCGTPRRSESRPPLMLDFRHLFDGAIAGLWREPNYKSVEERRALDAAPRANVAPFLAEDVTAEPAPALQAFESEGFVRVNRALSYETATLLREYVDNTLEKKLEFESDEILGPGR